MADLEEQLSDEEKVRAVRAAEPVGPGARRARPVIPESGRRGRVWLRPRCPPSPSLRPSLPLSVTRGLGAGLCRPVRPAPYRACALSMGAGTRGRGGGAGPLSLGRGRVVGGGLPWVWVPACGRPKGSAPPAARPECGRGRFRGDSFRKQTSTCCPDPPSPSGTRPSQVLEAFPLSHGSLSRLPPPVFFFFRSFFVFSCRLCSSRVQRELPTRNRTLPR